MIQMIEDVKAKDSNEKRADQSLKGNEETKNPLCNLKDYPTLPIDKLKEYPNHIYKYGMEKRIKEKAESIEKLGLLQPVTVVPDKGSDTYHILIGHARVGAFRKLRSEGYSGYDEIAVIIREDLDLENDDKFAEATLIMLESNLQLSYNDLPLSEKIDTIALHYQSVRKQGNRTDIKSRTSPQVDEKSTAAWQETNRVYGVSKSIIERYSQLYRLIVELKRRLSNKEFGTTPALDISFISEDSQRILDEVLEQNPDYEIDMVNAKELRRLYEENDRLTETEIKDILNKKKEKIPEEYTSVRIGKNIYNQYFTSKHTQKDIENEIAQALKYYRAAKNSKTTVDKLFNMTKSKKK